MREVSTLLCGLTVLAWPVWATSCSQPKREEVPSANGEFLLVVDPESEVHEVEIPEEIEGRELI